MSRFAFGLDISDRSAELVSLFSLKGSVIVDRYGRTEIPPGVIERGVIVDKEKLMRVLAVFLDEFFGPKRARVSVGISLPETLVYSGAYSLPVGLDRFAVDRELSLAAADRLPISVEDTASDIRILGQSEESQDIFYSVAQREDVAVYDEVLEAIGIKPQFFDSEAMALARALADGGDQEPLVIADIGARTTALDVFDQGNIQMASVVSVAGDQMSAAIESQLNMTLEQAERLKQSEGLDARVADGRAFPVLQRPLAEIIDEIRKTADYYGKKSGRPVRQVILAGGTSLTPCIVDHIASNLRGLTVKIGNPLRGIKVERLDDAENFKNSSILYATAIGLAIRALGVRTAPGIDLAPGRSGRHGGAAMISWLRQAEAAFHAMTTHKRKSSKKKETEIESAAVHQTEKPAPVSVPSADMAEPEAAAAEPSVEETEESTESSETSADYGHNIGDVLGAEYGAGVKTETEVQEDEVPTLAPTKPSRERLAIESILDHAKKRGDGMEDDSRSIASRIATAALTALVIIFLIAAVGGVIMFVKKNGLSALPFFQDKNAPSGADVTSAVPAIGLSSVSVDALAGLDKKTAGDRPFISARIIETDVSAADTFSTTGEIASSQSKSKGYITVYDTTARAFTFVATTRFLTADGVLFRMDKTTAIPANGSVKVAVTADKAGSTGDIGPSDFTIPGLSPDLQKVVYGKSDEAMSGGAGQVKAVGAADLDAAKAKLSAKLQQTGDANFQAMLQAGEKLLPDLVTSSEVSFAAPAAGTPATSFTAKLTLRYRAMVIPEKDVLALLQSKLNKQLPTGASSADYSLAAPQYTVEAFPDPFDSAQIRLEAAVSKANR